MEGQPADGDVVDVVDPSGAFIARGLFNSKSQIRIRLYSWDSSQELDLDFWDERIRRATGLRNEMRQSGVLKQEDAFRLVNSEGDGLSGLVVDVYPPFAVVQLLSLGLHARRKDILSVLADCAGVPNFYERSDEPVSRYEGLPARTGVVLGEKPPPLHTIRENGLSFLVDLRQGHKTGFYLDQKDNRARAALYARNGRVLDAFCYTGAFGICAARAGASVMALDESNRALELAAENARLNGLDGRYEARKGSAAPQMRALIEAGEQFDTVILDPPKFARSRHDLDSAFQGYREINLLALKLVKDGGLLFTCSCSGAVSAEMFQDVLHETAHEAGREAKVLEVRSQSPDHPVALSCPESRYLKCLVCAVH
jgi:23S rRNA (cytosine1962-C5)-methyltransferase